MHLINLIRKAKLYQAKRFEYITRLYSGTFEFGNVLTPTFE